MIATLLLVPFFCGVIAFFTRRKATRLALLLGGAGIHSAITVFAWEKTPEPVSGAWLALDSTGLLFLSITSFLFFLIAIYEIGYLKEISNHENGDNAGNHSLPISPEGVFIGCQLLFLSAMTLVILSQHFGLIWVAIEATTLASAPLIYFHRNSHSLEATWKYLLICSIGIALALLGIFFLSISAFSPRDSSISLVFQDLIANADKLDSKWLKAAFILIVVGYGTKMGLAPLHTWLPDAHSESPSVISAMLSGVLLNCAFLGIFRFYEVCVKSGLFAFANEILILFGLASLIVAAVFIIGQSNFKRLLAYSSVEHMGLLALGIGLGGTGVYGSMLHAVNHSVTKAMLFLMSGVILSIYQSKKVADVRGIFSVSQWIGLLWIAGFLSIAGSPPFGVFVSEFTIIKTAFDNGKTLVGIIALAMLGVIFIGMASIFIKMSTGVPRSEDENIKLSKLCPTMVLTPTALLLISLTLGFYIPSPLNNLLLKISRITTF
ncbi:MAG: proton-conducting transporter membrane subunit [Verrucomicrobiae bacterium]|nr:proton-conducting transporter membrane subunit [Verrucomicrobiae bacterium]